MAEVELNGTTLWYDREGSGPPCLVCHGGLGLDHSLYRTTMQPLTERCEVVWYDHRGNGRSGRPPLETLTMEQLADDAAGLLDRLGLGPAVVLGHSYGGFVAQELALRHPASVAALVLVATGPGQLGTGEVEGEDGDGDGEPMADALVDAFSTVPTSDEEMRTVFGSVLPHYVRRFDVARLTADFESTVVSVDAMLRGFEVLAGWSAVDRLPTITVPTLVIGGRNDPIMSWPQQVRIAKRVGGAELAIVEDSSHFVWLDDPDRFWSLVEGFLDRI